MFQPLPPSYLLFFSFNFRFAYCCWKYWYKGRLFYSFYNGTGCLRLQRHFIFVHPRVRRTRNFWNLRNYFLPSQTHLPVVTLTAGILFEVIVLLRKLLGFFRTESGGQVLASLPWNTQFFPNGIILKVEFIGRQTQRQQMSWFTWFKSASCFKIKDLQQYRKQCMD